MIHKPFLAVLLLALSACATLFPSGDGVPRVSTAAERAAAQPYIDAASDALLVAFTFKGIDQKTYDKGQKVLQEFRDQVALSETVPVDWPGMMHKAIRLSVIVLTPAEKAP